MYHLVYISSESERFSSADIASILDVSRRKNARLNITGILLYRNGSFLQVLEGEKADVLSLYQTICSDARHHGIITVLQEEITEREFPKWSMAYVELNPEAELQIPGFSDFLKSKFTAEEFLGRSSKVQALLDVFKTHMR